MLIGECVERSTSLLYHGTTALPWIIGHGFSFHVSRISEAQAVRAAEVGEGGHERTFAHTVDPTVSVRLCVLERCTSGDSSVVAASVEHSALRMKDSLFPLHGGKL